MCFVPFRYMQAENLTWILKSNSEVFFKDSSR